MTDAADPLLPLPDPLPPRTNEPYDAPSGADLIEAVRRYLADDLMPRTDGADRWLLRVAANALAIASREHEHGEGHRAEHTQRLAALGVANDAELSAAIRSGSLDHRSDDVRAALVASVRDKLAVHNPSLLG